MIALLDAHNEHYAEVARLCRPSKARYCQRHGYQFIEHSFGPLDRTAHWGRVHAIREHLPKFDYVLYLDTDTIITNPSITIESQIDPNYDVTVGRMPKFLTGLPSHLSTSAMLIKNCPWVMDFLTKWYAQTQFIDAPYHAQSGRDHGATLGGGGKWFEQSAYQFLYDTDDECRRRTKLTPDSWFNHREINHTPDAFLIHITSTEKGMADKLERIRGRLRKMVPSL